MGVEPATHLIRRRSGASLGYEPNSPEVLQLLPLPVWACCSELEFRNLHRGLSNGSLCPECRQLNRFQTGCGSTGSQALVPLSSGKPQGPAAVPPKPPSGRESRSPELPAATKPSEGKSRPPADCGIHPPGQISPPAALGTSSASPGWASWLHFWLGFHKPPWG